MATMKKPVKKYAMGGPMTTTSETTKKPKKVKRTFENSPDSGGVAPFTVKEQIERRKRLGLPTSEKEEKEYYAKMAREGGRNGKVVKKAKAGAKFDLNKDGKTTFKDVLIGRGVLPKTAKSGKTMKKAQNSSTVNPVRQQSNWKKEMDLKKKEFDLKKGELREKVKKIASSLTKSKSGGKMKKCKYGCK